MNRINQELRKSVNSEAAKDLLDIFYQLSRISCAGWLSDIEFFLWKSTLKNEGKLPTFAWKTVKQYEVNELIRLSNLCQGWWVWKDPQGEKFVSLNEMEQLFENWKNSRPAVPPLLEDDTENPTGIMYKLRQIKI
ncbi:MAG: hypothetical protein QNJ37_24240 [Crocosphaera sp.]|nr:hypothetical protein [Crocosphaera sp.]